MNENMPERDPRSRFEDEGIPDLQDGIPGQQWAVDPQEAPLPGDEPVAIDDYGTTAAEEHGHESLDGRLDREMPEEQALFDSPPQADELEGEEPLGEAEEEEVLTEESGLGVGSDLDTRYQRDTGTDPEWTAQPEEPSGTVWDEPRRAGRLVGPGEGAHADTEADEIATEVGPDGGGFSAEESAVRVDPE
ncbi:DUF5709 domain-containing protein [Streptosporangium soli]|nr:DUF5709 domain-containing protein [Streptosporangium sp. KLBMP 9127]